MKLFPRMTWRLCILLLLLPLTLALTGCSTSIISDVTRFHTLAPPAAETIEVVALDPTLQNSLEFGQYAEMVGQQLGRVGYRPPDGVPSLLIARIGYGLQPSEGGRDSGPRSSVGIGVGSGGRHSSVGVGISLPLGNAEPRQSYIRLLSLEIIRRSDGVRLYEGRVSSRGPESLPLTMPYLVNALFQDFPGESGSSSRVKATP
ncbi:MAG: hypothetical protein COB54_01560 [Alphaproteobacteria bacterium]|nr:MAG: hypothetical protein COB54_01560 [Alphaproteobacteria bacterium]